VTDEQPTVKVTLASIYEKLLEVDKKVDPVPELVKDHESRIRKLEIQVAIQWVGYGLLITLALGQMLTPLFD